MWSVLVEHQGRESPSTVVHEVMVSPENVKGKMHKSPDSVVQFDLR